MAKKNGQDTVYKMVTEKIIALLDAGTIPWRRPWKGGFDAPMNLVSKREYRGINVFLLAVQGYGSKYWVTYKQAQALGGNVRKGEKSTLVVFWKPIKETKTLTHDPITGQPLGPNDPTWTEEKTVSVVIRYYRVFNVEQCDGLDAKIPVEPESDGEPVEPSAAAEKIVAEMEGCPKINHGGSRAFYSPPVDKIQLPVADDFESAEAYAATKFHELIHATGHESRTGRVKNWSGFGSEPYAQEELVAEMGAAFLNAKAGIIDDRELENAAAYIANWKKKLADDPKLVVVAAAQAQKAADWVLNVRPEKKSKPSKKAA